MNTLKTYLEGGDLRSIAKVDQLLLLIKTQNDFDDVFEHLFSDDQLIVMRAADAIEKISKANPEYLKVHKKDLLKLLSTAQDKELKWHLALLVSRTNLTTDELQKVWATLSSWAKDVSESKIVRVNALQTLYDLAKENEKLKKNLELIIKYVSKENIPSINARIKKLMKCNDSK